jgi:tetratricopeptide (TPR) repeat protein
MLDELENAYELIGDIEGGNGASANLGDLPAALENHNKALAVAQQALRLFPEDPGAQRAVAIYELKIGEDQVEQGDRALGVENYRKGLEIYKALAAKSDNPKLTRDMHLIYTRIGNAYLMEGKSKEAVENYRAALEILKQTGTDIRDALARLDFATTEALLGQAMAQAGDRASGLARLTEAIHSIEREAALDPMHVEINRALGLLYVWRGQIQARSANLDGALADFRKTAAIFGKLVASDPQDVDTAIHLAAANTKIADTLASIGDLIGALDAYRRAIAVAEVHAHSVPPNVQAQYTVADAYSGIGNAYLLQATKSRTPANRAKQWTEARDWFQKSFSEWKQLRNPGVMSPGGFDTAGPSFVSRKIADCDANLKELTLAEPTAE